MTLPEGNILAQQRFCAVVEITWLGHRPSLTVAAALWMKPTRSTECFQHDELPTNRLIACYSPKLIVGCTRLLLRGFMIDNKYPVYI